MANSRTEKVAQIRSGFFTSVFILAIPISYMFTVAPDRGPTSAAAGLALMLFSIVIGTVIVQVLVMVVFLIRDQEWKILGMFVANVFLILIYYAYGYYSINYRRSGALDVESHAQISLNRLLAEPAINCLV